ncbi:protein BIC1-like [Sesamum indicum]|uniref:Protein BIC1-like n=1 Tax=Sesamum indicum TaxID=4182 RepID=A0A8M8V550_SESIN|nr:protein BIC1-like [Sesamum indicum]
MLPPNQQTQSTPKTTQNPFSSGNSSAYGSTQQSHQTVEAESSADSVQPKKMLEEEKKNTCTTVTVATGIENSCSSGRERLQRHRIEVAGRVWIPDMWGQEAFLKDWIDCGAFDASLVNSSVMSARAALVEQGRTLNSATPTVANY